VSLSTHHNTDRIILLTVDTVSYSYAKRCNQLQIDIPYNGRIVRFLREEDCTNTLFTQDLHEIYDFVDKWNNPHFEFLDPVLEKQRKEFLVQLTLLKNELLANTWTCNHNRDLSSMEIPDYDFSNPRWQKAEEMNELATQIYDLYEDLILDCKRRIGTPLI
jgi:hypothetical protein